MRFFYFILTCLLVFCFFKIDYSNYHQLDEANNDKIRKNILRKLDELKEKKLLECNRAVLARAEAHVDSLVANISSTPDPDTSLVPPRPIRPAYDHLDSQRIERIPLKSFFESRDSTFN